MTTAHSVARHRCDLHRPVRNHYFYGKLLDAYHFELETNYLNSKRWLLNRLVSSYGVVCGLNVELSKDTALGLEIDPGLAIDKHGREIVVPNAQPFRIEMSDTAWEQEKATPKVGERGKDCFEHKRHLLICYHECLADPAPVHTSDCDHAEPCEPGSIHERFKFKHKHGHIKPPCSPLKIDDLITQVAQERGRRGGSVESDYEFCYKKLVELVSKPCAQCQPDPCIPLANFCIERYPQDGTYRITDVDITIRPIVYNNDLLFQLLMSLIYDRTDYQNTK